MSSGVEPAEADRLDVDDMHTELAFEPEPDGVAAGAGDVEMRSVALAVLDREDLFGRSEAEKDEGERNTHRHTGDDVARVFHARVELRVAEHHEHSDCGDPPCSPPRTARNQCQPHGDQDDGEQSADPRWLSETVPVTDLGHADRARAQDPRVEEFDVSDERHDCGHGGERREQEQDVTYPFREESDDHHCPTEKRRGPMRTDLVDRLCDRGEP